MDNLEKEIALTFSPEDAHLSIDDFQLNHDGHNNPKHANTR